MEGADCANLNNYDGFPIYSNVLENEIYHKSKLKVRIKNSAKYFTTFALFCMLIKNPGLKCFPELKTLKDVDYYIIIFYMWPPY